MNKDAKDDFKLPTEQEAIREKCFHPSGAFVEFPIEDVETSIPARFEKIAKIHAHRLAIKQRNHLVTYAELNGMANRIAWRLQERWGSTSEPVLVMTDPGLWCVLSCLGILKAGKFFVTADPKSHPAQLAAMFERFRGAAVLTETRNFEAARSSAMAWQHVIDIEKQCAEGILLENVGLNTPPDAPAQLRYTSGSTGRPKGVLRSHRRNLHSCMLTINAAHIGCQDRLIILRNYMLKDSFNGLLTGALIFPYDVRSEGLVALADLVTKEGITYYTSTPSLFRYFIGSVHDERIFPSVRFLQLGGEPLATREVTAFRRHFSDDCVLMNQLSSNETGSLCQYFVGKTTDIDLPLVPVGYPVNGKEICLVDETGQGTKAGEAGEIVVKSRYLAWNSPEHASDLSAHKGDQYYATGDLGRWLPDGRLLYIGRKDDQVKIRGFKFGVTEIQATLLQNPHVHDAAVTVWEDNSREKYLVAYVVSRVGESPDIGALRSYLSAKLPEYMIPSKFIFLESLPMMNGKLNRNALPKPDGRRPELQTQYVHPNNDLEVTIAEIWSRVLGINEVGIHDAFFDLGGDSLGAMRVIAKLSKRFQMDLTPESLFGALTVAEMANAVAKQQRSKRENDRLAGMLGDIESMTDDEARCELARNKVER